MAADKTGMEYYHYVESGEMAHKNYNLGGTETANIGYKKYKDDDKGHWYVVDCDPTIDPTVYDQFYKANPTVYVKAGKSAPTPVVAPELLRDIAAENLKLPDPKLDWNPKRAGNQGTLVNLDTWFWLEDRTTTRHVRASAGTQEATVTATFKGMKVSAPGGDGEFCPGPITPYSAGGDPSCGVVFSQASSHLGLLATPVTVSATWFATWASKTEEQGPIAVQPAPVAPPAPTDIQVDEVQTLVTSNP